MYLEVNNKNLSHDDIRNYVKKYKNQIEGEKRGRYFNILKMSPKGKYGLDYGCGWGAFTKLLAEQGNNMVGQDLSTNEIEICKYTWNKSANLEFTDAPIESFEDHKFEFVVSNQVIEHTHNPGNYLNQINRVLKKKGELIISLPNIINPRYCFPLLSKNLERLLVNENTRILSQYKKNRDHIQAWDPVHFARLVATVGFKVEKFSPLEGVPMPRFFQKYKLPVYMHPKGRLRHYSYTMAFQLTKVTDSNIQGND